MEQKKLPRGAYGGVNGTDYVPYVTDKSKTGSNAVVIIIGILIATLFAASTAYSGMKSGMTVAAGIPGAILGGAMVAALAKEKGILGRNVVQGMASGGESIASGMIFVLPAVLLIGGDITFIEGFIAGLGGVLLGLGFASLVHNYLIVEEHGKLMYPESMAISETLVTSESGGNALKFMGIGFAIGGVVHALSYNVFGWVNNTISFVGQNLAGAEYKFRFETEVNPMLLGIGFIVGLETSMAMFAGAVLANFAVLPLLAYFASMAADTFMVWNNPEMQINQMDIYAIGSSYIKYIGAGMMLCGGIIGAIKLIPIIVSSLKDTLGAKPTGQADDSAGLSKMVILIGAIIIIVGGFFIATSPAMALVAGILSIGFILMFAIVAGRLTGTIGTSNLPVSGMTIASLTVLTIIFVAFGWTDQADNEAILLFATFIVTGISTAGGYMQSQKVTYIVGGNKKEMMNSFAMAAIVGVATVTAVIMLLSDVLLTDFALPQASLMATLTQGIMNGELPWVMIFTGVAMALVLNFLRLPIMTIAIGFYLPMATVSIVVIGSLVRWFVEKATENDADREVRIENGVSLSSGLVAGASIIGLIGIALQVSGVITPTYVSEFAGSNAAAVLLLVVLLVGVIIPIMSSKAKVSK